MRYLRWLGFFLLITGVIAEFAYAWHLYTGAYVAKSEALGGLTMYGTMIGGLLLLCGRIFEPLE